MSHFRLIHRVRVHLTPAQRAQLRSWRPRLATLQLCGELLHTEILDGRRPKLVKDPVQLLRAALAGDGTDMDSNRSVVGHYEVRLPHVASQTAFEAALLDVQRLLEQAEPQPTPLPARTAQSLRREFYDSTLRGPARVASDLPRARPAGIINTFAFHCAVARDDLTLALGLGLADSAVTQTLPVAAEIFTLPPAVQAMAFGSDGAAGRLAQVAVELTNTGDWAWLLFTSPVAPVLLPVPSRAALGIDLNIHTQLVGWDGAAVDLTKVIKASGGSIEERRRAFDRAVPQIEALLDQLHEYALVGIEGTGQTASMSRMTQDLSRGFLPVVLDRLASTGLRDARRQLLQTYAPYSSINCPETDCSGRGVPAGEAATWAPSILRCPDCGLKLQRDFWAARNHYQQLLEPNELRRWWQQLPAAFRPRL